VTILSGYDIRGWDMLVWILY